MTTTIQTTTTPEATTTIETTTAVDPTITVITTTPGSWLNDYSIPQNWLYFRNDVIISVNLDYVCGWKSIENCPKILFVCALNFKTAKFLVLWTTVYTTTPEPTTTTVPTSVQTTTTHEATTTFETIATAEPTTTGITTTPSKCIKLKWWARRKWKKYFKILRKWANSVAVQHHRRWVVK